MKKNNKNLLSISGKIGSGKDLLGKIFQVLLDKPKAFDKLDVITEEDVNYAVFDQPSFEIKKFADKLKDIVCILLNCTRKQLENREFKEKELGEEWWYIKKWYPANPEHKKVFTLIPCIDFDSRIFDGDDSCAWEVIKTTPRLLLQLLGTEAGREIIHPNIWVNSLMSGYKVEVIPNENYGSNKTKPNNWIITEEGKHEYLLDNSHWVYKDEVNVIFPKWIITDTRFPNEFEAVKSRGGICIKIEREVKSINGMCKDKCDNFPDCKPCGDIKPLHESETALDKQTFDYIFLNNGSIKDLVEASKKFLKDYKYIK